MRFRGPGLHEVHGVLEIFLQVAGTCRRFDAKVEADGQWRYEMARNPMKTDEIPCTGLLLRPRMGIPSIAARPCGPTGHRDPCRRASSAAGFHGSDESAPTPSPWRCGRQACRSWPCPCKPRDPRPQRPRCAHGHVGRDIGALEPNDNQSDATATPSPALRVLQLLLGIAPHAEISTKRRPEQSTDPSGAVAESAPSARSGLGAHHKVHTTGWGVEQAHPWSPSRARLRGGGPPNMESTPTTHPGQEVARGLHPALHVQELQ